MSHENVEIARAVRIPLTPETRRRRSFDEGILIRLPAFARWVSAVAARLPRKSRLRRTMLAYRLRQAYAAGNRQDFELLFIGMDLASYEYRPSRDLLPPDADSVFEGKDGYLRLWRYWLEAFGDIRWDPEEALDFGDHVLVTTSQSGHGSGSGVGLSKRVFQLFDLRRGLVQRQQDFLDLAEALEAVGLSEQDAH
jgi:hypothetical protein